MFYCTTMQKHVQLRAGLWIKQHFDLGLLSNPTKSSESEPDINNHCHVFISFNLT